MRRKGKRSKNEGEGRGEYRREGKKDFRRSSAREGKERKIFGEGLPESEKHFPSQPLRELQKKCLGAFLFFCILFTSKVHVIPLFQFAY